MGCQPERQKIITSNSIIDQLIRIRVTSQQHQLRLSRQLKQQQQLLLQVFDQNVSWRSGVTEKAMIGRAVYTKNLLFIHKYIQVQAKTLLQKKSLFQSDTNEILLPSINVLVYCSLFLNEQTLTRFHQLIKKRFPVYVPPSDSQIRYQLIKYHRYTNQVTFQMQNTFILEFCVHYSIGLQKVKEVGHSYGYGLGHINYQV